MVTSGSHEVVIVGGGLAGLSAAIYLARALRDVTVVDAGHPMATWEPDVQNYLGFPHGISGEALVQRGRAQAERFGAAFVRDEILRAARTPAGFELQGRATRQLARSVLVATGGYHLPPDIPGVAECLGQSLFFCQDCDGYRVMGRRLGVLGTTERTVTFALALLSYSPHVVLLTNGEVPQWDEQHTAWLAHYAIPVHAGRIVALEQEERQLTAVCFEGGRCLGLDAMFTRRGDLAHHALARMLGAVLDGEGQIMVDAEMATSIPGLYAAGCVTAANCQMIIAAGQGATAAQAIARDLFQADLREGRLHRLRITQLRATDTSPDILH